MSSFGAEVDAIWPPVEGLSKPKVTPFGCKLLEQCQKVKQPKETQVDLIAFMAKSREFPLKFGVETCRVSRQPAKRHGIIAQQVASAYPLIHERTLLLYLDYLEHKCQWGNPLERSVYQPLTLCDFVQRLLEKRCASFFARNDKFLLLTGEMGVSGFEPIGTSEEKAPLCLSQVLSYDDIKLSALLSVSSLTEFINEGERANCGRITQDKSKLQPEGVIVGLIGARLSRRNLMEFQEIVIARSQNTHEQGYGQKLTKSVKNKAQGYRRVWRKFYETRDYVRSEVSLDHKRFDVSGNKQDIFDNLVMKRRYAISFDMLMMEAQVRARSVNKLAYLHVVGFGLGVWKVAPQQERIFLETFEQRLLTLGKQQQLSHLGVVHFSWFTLSKCGGLHNGAFLKIAPHPKGGIHINISKRNPAQKLNQPEHSDMLLVVSYAWDGNALPGNEFWMKMLKSTGDSSTACHTLITELHNPHINTKYCSGRNLHIASAQLGIVHIAEYAKYLLKRLEQDEQQPSEKEE